MKRINAKPITIAITILIFLMCTGCDDNNKVSEIDQTTAIQLYETFKDVAMGTPVENFDLQSWSDEDFINWLSYALHLEYKENYINFLSEHNWKISEETIDLTADISAEVIEQFTMQFLDISIETLQSFNNYNDETKTYTVNWIDGLGGGTTLAFIDYSIVENEICITAQALAGEESYLTHILYLKQIGDDEYRISHYERVYP